MKANDAALINAILYSNLEGVRAALRNGANVQNFDKTVRGCLAILFSARKAELQGHLKHLQITIRQTD